MSSERYQPKQAIENAKETCHYCHSTSSLQQIGNEKVCAHCGTRIYSTAAALNINSMKFSLQLAQR